MEVGSVASGMALRLARPAAGPRLPPPWAKPCRPCHFGSCRCPSSLISLAVVRAYQKPQPAAYDEDEDMATSTDFPLQLEAQAPSVLTLQHKALLALMISLGFALGSVETALALGPEGPLVEEFWDNMRRYGLYFLTVFTGGLYSLLQPIFSLLRNPLTAIITIAFLSGSFYLLYLVLNSMLGVTAFNYDYA